MKIPAEVAEILCYSNDGREHEGWRKMYDQERGSGRWNAHHWLVLQEIATGDQYAVEYSLGLTENQENDFPWKPDYQERPEFVDAFQVWPTTIITVEYVKEKPDES